MSFAMYSFCEKISIVTVILKSQTENTEIVWTLFLQKLAKSEQSLLGVTWSWELLIEKLFILDLKLQFPIW